MNLVPLFGHDAVRVRLENAAARGTLPGSLLLHGPAGVGKQRLALHLAQRLLCTAPAAPCGSCQHCQYAQALTHPDLHWVFPRPRPKGGDADDLDAITADMADAVQERAAAHGLYPAPSGSEGIFVATVRAMVLSAARTPAMAARKVFIVGDADRMVPQEGGEAAANAFLKLLEEPPANTTIIITSSQPGALLPTIRSRVAAVRMGRVADAAMREFVEHHLVGAWLDEHGCAPGTEARVRLAGGAPGALLSQGASADALQRAQQLLDAALGGRRVEIVQAAFAQGGAGARGAFSDALDALTYLLNRRVRSTLSEGNTAAAAGAARAADAVELAKRQASGNLNPQLVTFTLLSELEAVLR